MDDRAAVRPEDSWIKPENSQNEAQHLVIGDLFVNRQNTVHPSRPLGRIVAAILRPLHDPITHDTSHRRIDAAIAAAADAITTSIDGLSEPTVALATSSHVVISEGATASVLNASSTARPTVHVAYNDNANSWWRNFIPRPSMTPEEVRAQYYATYDPMTGVRIAATLGAIMSLFALFLIFKARCKSIRSRLNL